MKFKDVILNLDDLGFEYFKSAYDLDVEDRAIFFKTNLSDIHCLNMSHPGIGGPICLEPCHPYTKDQVPFILERLGYPNKLVEELLAKGFDLISIPLISIYYPELGSQLRECFFLENREYLFDPYYGVVFRKRDDKIINTYIELSNFFQYLNKLQASKKKKYFKEKGKVLSEGVQLGKKCFHHRLGENYLANCEKETVSERIVETEEDFFQLIAVLRKCVRTKKNTELWFRGQTTDYPMFDRKGLSKKKIVPYGNLTDSMLVPSLYRCIDEKYEDLDKYNSFISNFQQWAEYIKDCLGPRHTIIDANTPGKKKRLVDKYDPTTIIKFCNTDGQITDLKVIDWHFGVASFKSGLMLQHYGAPTTWLDITKDPQVALWMATHRFSQEYKKYQPYSGSGKSPSTWPTIFVFLLHKNHHPYLDSAAILEGSNILRPQRQKCGLLGGSSNLARNHSARYISLKIRISPVFKNNLDIDQKYYFPDSHEDEFLKGLLEINAKISNKEFEIFNPI